MPGGHLMQVELTVAASAVEYVPCSHATQEWQPDAEQYFPRAQSEQLKLEVAAAGPLYDFPGAQRRHAVALVRGEYDPETQGAHAVKVAPAYPTLQTHVVLFAKARLPVGHCWQSALTWPLL